MNQLTAEQLKWCEQHLPEGRWKLNTEGLVDVKGNVDLNEQNFQRLPVPFGRVNGHFDLEGCTQLLTLEGSPLEVGGWFDCGGCISLQSLKGAPQKVGEWFGCEGCTGLESVEGAPQYVKLSFWCRGCTKLESLEGVPQHVGESLDCDDCTSLPEWVHSLANDFNDEKISWEEFLKLHEKFIQKPKLAQAKKLGLF